MVEGQLDAVAVDGVADAVPIYQVAGFTTPRVPPVGPRMVGPRIFMDGEDPIPYEKSVNEAYWEANMAVLAAFKAEHGHCRVPYQVPGRPAAGLVGHETAAAQEAAGRRPPEPEDHGGAGGQAGCARVRVEPR